MSGLSGLSGLSGIFGGSRTTSLSANGVFYYKMDETSGIRYDSIGVNDLSDNNTVGSASGKISTAARFVAGDADCLIRANNPTLQTGDISFSFSLWIYIEALIAGTIFSKAEGDANEYILWLINGNQPRFQIMSGLDSFYYSATWGANLSLNTWYHLYLFHDAVNNQMGIRVNNGTAVVEPIPQGPRAGTDVFKVSGSAFSTNFYSGRVDEFGMFKRLFTDAEVTRIYNGGLGLGYPF